MINRKKLLLNNKQHKREHKMYNNTLDNFLKKLNKEEKRMNPYVKKSKELIQRLQLLMPDKIDLRQKYRNRKIIVNRMTMRVSNYMKREGYLQKEWILHREVQGRRKLIGNQRRRRQLNQKYRLMKINSMFKQKALCLQRRFINQKINMLKK